MTEEEFKLGVAAALQKTASGLYGSSIQTLNLGADMAPFATWFQKQSEYVYRCARQSMGVRD